MEIRKKIELLAPAGSPEHFIAALDGGTDAVYLGGKQFSARKFAGNFSDEEIENAVRQAHIKGVRVYVTLNTLIADKEMRNLEGYLYRLAKLEIDGILVQDLGVASVIKRIAPHIPLHGSTQMTVSNASGVRFLESLGFQRVVLSRELSLEEIKNIVESTKMEIEVFVHGALCVCYSGQCLMSSFIGNRSGNRGSCAQPCRMPYQLVDNAGRILQPKKGKYILSMKDMMGLEHVPDLINAKVDSLKIEGRMKSPEYVYQAVLSYRKAIDAAYNEDRLDLSSIRLNLKKEFNRGYTASYLGNCIGTESITQYAPGNHGVEIGRVLSLTNGSFLFKAKKNYTEEVTGVSFETADNRIAYSDVKFQKHIKGDSYKLFTLEKPKMDGKVYWHFESKKAQFSIKNAEHKIQLKFKFNAVPGQLVNLSVTDDENNTVTVNSKIVAVKAIKQATSAEEIKNQLSRLGNTWFKFLSAEIINNGCMVPRSIINKMRQEAISKLEILRMEKMNIFGLKVNSSDEIKKVNYSFREESASIVIKTDRIEHVKSALNKGVKRFIFGGESFHHKPLSPDIYKEALDLVHARQGKITFTFPRVVREFNEVSVKKEFLHLCELKPDGIEIEFPGMIEWVKDYHINLPLECGPSFNLFNKESVHFLENIGVSAAYLSQELTIPQIKNIVIHSQIPLGVYVYGRTELMVSEYCVINAVMTDNPKIHCPQPCLKHNYLLQDQKGECFPVKTDEWCHMHILNSHVLDMRPYLPELLKTGIKRLCLNLKGIEEDAGNICQSYLDILKGKELPPEPIEQNRQFTRGHFFRGVL